MTASFRPFPALKRGFRDAAISIVSPVLGLRPLRAARSPTENVPKPTKLTVSPLRRPCVMASNTASTARAAEALLRSACSATFSISSDLFTWCSLASGPKCRSRRRRRNQSRLIQAGPCRCQGKPDNRRKSPRTTRPLVSVRAYRLRLGFDLDLARFAAFRRVGKGLWHTLQGYLQNLIDPPQRLDI